MGVNNDCNYISGDAQETGHSSRSQASFFQKKENYDKKNGKLKFVEEWKQKDERGSYLKTSTAQSSKEFFRKNTRH